MANEKDDVETASAIFAKFAHRLDKGIDEYHAFLVIRDYIVNFGIELEAVPDLVDLIRETKYDLRIHGEKH